MPQDALRLFNVTFVGLTAQNAKRLLFTVVFLLLVFALRRLFRAITHLVYGSYRNGRAEFWTDQGIRLGTAALTILGLVSIWFSNPTNLLTATGLVGAGVAFALQKVITAIAAYFVLLRGKTFNLGDRIRMGGVRGDVIGLGFIQTTIMEMGEPPTEQQGDPSVWVRARQYTGRIVTVTNDKIFDQPVYNYTRDFPFIWEEMQIPVSYKDNRAAAERILLDVAERYTVKITEMSEQTLREMERRYLMKRSELKPRVFWRLTDNWIEMSVRFVAHESGIRDLKDRMSREIISQFDTAGVGIASGTYAVVEFPPIEIRTPAGSSSPAVAAPHPPAQRNLDDQQPHPSPAK